MTGVKRRVVEGRVGDVVEEESKRQLEFVGFIARGCAHNHLSQRCPLVEAICLHRIRRLWQLGTKQCLWLADSNAEPQRIAILNGYRSARRRISARCCPTVLPVTPMLSGRLCSGYRAAAVRD